MEFTTCPECRSIARVLDRFVLESTDGPVEHVRTQCVERHWFVLPAAALVRPASSRPAAAPSPVRGTVPGAAGCG
jgi:hypothetical protein